MKKLYFLLIAQLLFSYQLVVKNFKYVGMLNDLGVLCEKDGGYYVCAQSNSKERLKRVQEYLQNNLNIKTYIIKGKSDYYSIVKPAAAKKEVVSKKPKRVYKPEPQVMEKPQNINYPVKKPSGQIKSGYCIQIISSDRLKKMEKIFQNIHLPLSRIEKIGGYYVIRAGESRHVKSLKPFLQDAKKINKSAYIRKCDLIPQRIIRKNF